MLKLLLIRHGESTGNQDRKMAGHTQDALTDHGRHQCCRLAQHLKAADWSPTHIYTSPLRRALESVDELVRPWQWQLPATEPSPILNAYSSEKPIGAATQPCSTSPRATHPIPILRISDDLQEFDAGVLTGLSWTEAKQQFPQLCQRLESSSSWVPIPAAETPLAGYQRATRFQQQLLANHTNEDQVWIVAHQWIMEQLIASVMGCDRTWKIEMPNTAIFEFWLDCDRDAASPIDSRINDFWQIKRFNESSHLI